MWSGCLTASQGCKEGGGSEQGEVDTSSLVIAEKNGDFWFIPMGKLLGVVRHHSYLHMYIGCSNSSVIQQCVGPFGTPMYLLYQPTNEDFLLICTSIWFENKFKLTCPCDFFFQHFFIMITTTFLGPPYGGCWGSGTWWCIAKSLWMAAAFPVWRIPYTDICLKWHSSCIGHRSQCCPMVKDVDPGAELFASYWWFQAWWPQHNRAVSIAPLGSCALFISAANAVFPKDISSSLFYSSWCLDECVITLKNIRVYCPCDHLTVFHC